MKRTKNFVFDTNVLISAFLFVHSKSKPRLALNKALEQEKVVVSDETILELSEKIMAPKFDKYVTIEERLNLLQQFQKTSRSIKVTEQVTLCRDPDDDKFLSLAKAAEATAIVTGDDDLLVLNSFDDIAIITPDEFLKMKF